jgi:hypothetical protein
MWQSIKEYVTSLGRWAWVVMIDFILAGASAYLDISNSAPIPRWVWISLFLVGFIVAPFISFHRLRQERDQIKIQLESIRNAQPLIEVTPEMDNRDIYYLNVHNVGEYAEFEAQIEVLEGKSFALGLPEIYSAYWDRTKRDKTEIMKGQKDKLNIATLQMQTRVLSACFRFHYYGTSYFGESLEGIHSVDSTSWIPGSDQVLKPAFKLKVTISAKPSLKDGAFSRVYELSPDGFSEASS